jgi:hypothetical protein
MDLDTLSSNKNLIVPDGTAYINDSMIGANRQGVESIILPIPC